MPAPAIKHSLNDYPQLSITAYREQLQGKEAHSIAIQPYASILQVVISIP